MLKQIEFFCTSLYESSQASFGQDGKVRGIENIQFLHLCLVERMEQLRNRKLFYLVKKRKRKEKTKNLVCINLLTCPYYIKNQYFKIIIKKNVLRRDGQMSNFLSNPPPPFYFQSRCIKSKVYLYFILNPNFKSIMNMCLYII